jgi:hypothetical protein
MNAVLRIFVWLLALSVVALPVVAVVNGWVGAERWPLAKLRVHGEFKRGAGRTAAAGAAAVCAPASSRSSCRTRRTPWKSCRGWKARRSASSGRTCWK